MAAVNTIRTYLRDVIGLGNDTMGLTRANAIIDEGLDDIVDLHELHLGKGISTLCTNVRKPSGTIPQPGCVEPNLNPNGLVAPQVARPGTSIPAICEQRLVTAAYGAHIYTSMGRVVGPAALSRARLREFNKHKTTVDNHNDPESMPPLSKTFTVMKMLDQFPTHLREMMGVSKVALSYIIRDNADPPNTLPQLIANKPWSGSHTCLMDELIAYTKHEGPEFEADNAQVYNLLSHLLAGTSAMTSITKHQRKRDGRKAYLDLVTHNMGSAKWEKTVEVAEEL